MFQSAKAAFEAIDKNGDGFLQKEELQRALETMAEQGEIELGNNVTVLDLGEKVMQDFDQDGNGKLDIDEFVTLIKSSHFEGLVNIGCSKVRRDCSITDIDLQLFLRSRYNIIVDLNEIRQTILPGLTMPQDTLPTKFGAGFGDDDSSLESTNTKIDLVELVAMLMMPVLLGNMRSKYHRESLMKTQQSRALSLTKRDFDESLRVPEPASSSDDIIKQVLLLVLQEVGINISSAAADNDSDQYPILTSELLKKILCQFGEKSLAHDDVLVEDMMKVVHRGSTSFRLERKGRTNHQSIRLTPAVFCRLLTSDILVWQNATHSHDIIHNNMEKFKTFQFSTAIVDSTANLFNRKSILFLLWVSMAMIFVSDWVSAQTLLSQEEDSYLQAGTRVALNGISCPKTANDDYNFGCTLWQQIATWLLRCGLIILLGLFVVWGGSLGNGLGSDLGLRLKALSISALVVFGIFPVVYAAINFGMTNELFWYTQLVSFAAVVAAIVIYMKSSIPTRNDKPWLGAKARNEQIMEQAACTKMMEGMISNALELHNNASKTAAQDNVASVVMQFQALSSKEINEEKAAQSIAVCWKRFFSGDLFEIDGIQISARLLAINAVQVAMSVLIILVGAKVTRFAVAAWEEGRAGTLLFGLVFQVLQYVGIDLDASQLGPIFCDKLNTTESMANFVSSTSFDMNTCETMSQVAVDAISERASSILYPLDKNMISVPLIATTVAGAIYTVFLAVVFIPSVVSTTMRFRSGTIPLFDSANNFLVYRERLDRPLELVGTLLWCTVLGPILFGAFFGVFLFLMLWQVTRGFMLRLIASVIGIGITFCIRWAFGVLYIDTTLRGFYRERVNQHNLCGLAVECVMIGLGIALAVFRALVCISISLIYIARADRNLFESDVTIGFGHPLLRTRDHLPVSFRKEILLQEAHHHPHIEVLGKAYLLKLQHGNGFSTRSGCCMRLIFVQALMPWLRQYREIVREQDAVMKISKSMSSFDQRRLSVTKSPPIPITRKCLPG